MYFYFSRFVNYFLHNQLLLISLILLIALFLFIISRKEMSKKVLILATVYFVIIAIIPTGKILMFFLEREILGENYKFEHLDGIIVLSGNEDIDKSQHYNQLYTSGTTYRLIESIKLSKKFPKAQIVFSGGSGSIFSKKLSTQVAENFFELFSYDINSIIFESNSSNTYENLIFTKKIVNPKINENWVLVTSAFHMRRALGVSNQLGLQLTPYPVDYRLSKNLFSEFFKFNLMENISIFQVASREVLGLFTYRLLKRL